MKNIIKLVLLTSMLTLWTGCESLKSLNGTASVPDVTSPATPYKRLALVKISEPLFYDINIMAPEFDVPGVTLPGRLAAGGFNLATKVVDEGRRNRRLTHTLDEWKFKLSENMTEDVKEELEALGYDVIVVEPGFRRGGKFVTSYPETPVPVDAYVDMYVSFAGYVALSHNQPYIPTIEAPVRVVDAFSGDFLYAATMNYGGPIPVDGPTDRPADAQHTVRGWDNLCAVDCEVSPAVSGLVAGSKAIAELLAHNVK
ncbi:MAG: hypothetical protein KUG80_01530 [Gammaproteobacteria bacterium]|nr:hypothetical protein [Gammaproteobacteria bacterium]